MKKLMSLLVIASVGCFVVGCSEGDDSKKKGKTETTVKKTETTKDTDKDP